MEGATGVTWPADVLPGTPQWERCRHLFTSDVNAAVLGFFDGGADEVLINEAHWTMRNLLLEQLDERAQMLTGRHKTLCMVEGVQHGDVDGMAFVGYHTGAGTEGVLAHTYLANSITGVWVERRPGERGPAQRARGRRVRRAGRAGHRRRPDLRGRQGLCAGRPLGRGQGLRLAVRGGVPHPGPYRRRHPGGGARRRPRWRCATSPPRGGPFTDRAGVRRRASGGGGDRRAGRGAQRRAARRLHRHRPCTRGSAASRRSPRSSRPRWRSNMADTAPSGGGIDAQALDEVVRFTSELIRDRHHQPRRRGLPGAPGRRVRGGEARDVGIEPTLLERTPGRTNVVARIEGTDPSRRRAARPRPSGRGARRARRLDACTPSPGRSRDGVVWGRGAVDMKNMDAMVLAVVRAWARHGVRPRRDIVLAFTADEEDSAAGRLRLPRRPAPGAVRGLHRGHQRVRRVHLPRRRPGCGSTPSRRGSAARPG